MSGYTPCACRDCFDIAFDDGLCDECEAADCHPEGCDCCGEDHECNYQKCQRDDAYGVGDEDEDDTDAN